MEFLDMPSLKIIRRKTNNMKKNILILMVLFSSVFAFSEDSNFYLRGTFYQDWMGFKSSDTDFYNRLSSRLKLTLWNMQGSGWTVSVDIRNRATLGEAGSNQFIIYNTKLTYDSPESKFLFSIGQMNLYDTAGVGQLTGGVVGYKFSQSLSFGGYAGIEPDIYRNSWDTGYRKYGIFTSYRGKGAKQFSLSFNRLDFDGINERQFVYANTLFPVRGIFVLYGSLEYELVSNIDTENRLAHIFTNARINLGKYADITANYSSGRGLDYHRFLLENSQNPTLQNNEIERYYYNEMYGMRLSVKPVKGIRVYYERRESELKDKGIKNKTNRFGLSAVNLFGSGTSLYGNYSMNRGDASESDSFILSVSKNFKKLSWSLSFSNYYNGVRMTGSDIPQIIHLSDRKTLTTDLFYVLNRSFSFSMEYAYSAHAEFGDHQFFVRMIYRKRK